MNTKSVLVRSNVEGNGMPRTALSAESMWGWGGSPESMWGWGGAPESMWGWGGAPESV